MSKFHSDKGASATELGLLAGLIAVTILVTISSTGDRLSQLFDISANSLNKVVTGAPIPVRPNTPIWAGGTLSGAAYAQYALATPIQIPAATGRNIIYSLENGDLNGLNFNPNDLTLSGTPTAPGSYDFTLKATNSAGSSSQNFNLTVGKFSTCQEILSAGYDVGDGIYVIYSGTNTTASSIRCDMTTDGGGWTEIIYGASTPEAYLSNFDVTTNTIANYRSATAGITWGNADSWSNSNQYKLILNINYSEVEVTYSGTYIDGLGLLYIGTSDATSDILSFTDAWIMNGSGQSLNVKNSPIFEKSGIIVSNRTDRISQNGSILSIRMAGYSGDPHTPRYIQSLKVR